MKREKIANRFNQGQDEDCLRSESSLWESGAMGHRDTGELVLLPPRFPGITAELKRVFDHPVQSGAVASQILSLCQGSISVADYYIRFCILVARSGWNALREGRSSRDPLRNKDKLAVQEEPGDLESLISPVIQLDNRLRERRRQRLSDAQ